MKTIGWLLLVGLIVLLIITLFLAVLARQDDIRFHKEFGVSSWDRSPEAIESVVIRIDDLCKDMLVAGWHLLELEQNPPRMGLGLRDDVLNFYDAYQRQLTVLRRKYLIARQLWTDAKALVQATDYPFTNKVCSWDSPVMHPAGEDGP